jgi:hypothetical protein
MVKDTGYIMKKKHSSTQKIKNPHEFTYTSSTPSGDWFECTKCGKRVKDKELESYGKEECSE